MRRTIAVAGLGALALLVGTTSTAYAQTYKAVPWTFVGKLAQCFPSPGGSKIVYANWLAGLGLPDKIAQSNPSGTQQGLLLNKNGPTPDCSAAGATIEGWVPGTPLTALGFDYRLGGHCGAGAPRFNVYVGDTTYFFGCASGTASAAPQDPTNWQRVTFTAPGVYPGAETFVWGTPVDGIEIVFDEGTDTASPSDPAGVGLATLDNIRINNTYITNKKGSTIVP